MVDKQEFVIAVLLVCIAIPPTATNVAVVWYVHRLYVTLVRRDKTVRRNEIYYEKCCR